MRAETVVLTGLALVAFASNSLLTRLALAARLVDAASFTSVRLVSGAFVLVLLVRFRAKDGAKARRGDWRAAAALFLYAAPFSFAYLRIGAAVGALVLFGVVQLTMIGWSLLIGERLSVRTGLALLMAMGGLLLLLLPSAAKPDGVGMGLMALAGVAWGVYSLRGKGSQDPLAETAVNFLFASPLALLLSLITLHSASWSWRGIGLAAASGALASGLGYAIWYRALRSLTGAQAAIVQLSVPVIAALGAVVFLEEALSLRLIVGGATVLAGTALALFNRRR